MYGFGVGCGGEGWNYPPSTSPTLISTAPVLITECYTTPDPANPSDPHVQLTLQFYLAQTFWGVPCDSTGERGPTYQIYVTDLSSSQTGWGFLTQANVGPLSLLSNPITFSGILAFDYNSDTIQIKIVWLGDTTTPAGTYPYGIGGSYDYAAAQQYVNVGACLAGGTALTLADGSSTQPIEAIKVGTLLAGPAGASARVVAKLSCLMRPSAMFVIPKGVYGAGCDLVLSRNHGFWASADEYTDGVPPRMPYRDTGCIPFAGSAASVALAAPAAASSAAAAGGAGDAAASSSSSSSGAGKPASQHAATLAEGAAAGGMLVVHNVKLAPEGAPVVYAQGVLVVGA